MSETFIQKLAETRAEEIFTKEYYQHVTDSWYLDEKFRFEGLQIGTKGRKPTKKEADVYMNYLSDLFEKYKDKWYGDALAQDYYARCIGFFKQILDTIEIGNENYSQFNVDAETINKIKDIGNIFVEKHNSFCK